MIGMAFPGSDLPVRSDLTKAHEEAWASIAGPGTWLDGERRVAIAAEARRAHRIAQRAVQQRLHAIAMAPSDGSGSAIAVEEAAGSRGD
jgi:hypothetical protein